ncbi:unnamed protein product [Camellia sinensis]
MVEEKVGVKSVGGIGVVATGLVSEAIRTRAKVLADEIGSWHLDVNIDGVVSALLSLFQTLTGKRPRYK